MKVETDGPKMVWSLRKALNRRNPVARTKTVAVDSQGYYYPKQVEFEWMEPPWKDWGLCISFRDSTRPDWTCRYFYFQLQSLAENRTTRTGLALDYDGRDHQGHPDVRISEKEFQRIWTIAEELYAAALPKPEGGEA